MRLKVIYRCVFDIPADYSIAVTMTPKLRRPSPRTFSVPLPAGLQKKYTDLVLANGLAAELQAACTYVGSLEIEPSGLMAPFYTHDDVKKLVQATGTVMFAGSLSRLALQQRAITTLDFGKLNYIIETADTDAALHKLMDCIVVNVDASSPASYVRANCDAEIDGLCLLMHWCSNDTELTARLNMIAADLVFEGRALGEGSKLFAAKFDLMNAEEKRRKVIGVNMWRKCLFLIDYLATIKADGRHENIKNSGEKLMKVMGEDCRAVDDWNVDILSRYLGIGRRLNDEKVRRLIHIEMMNTGKMLPALSHADPLIHVSGMLGCLQTLEVPGPTAPDDIVRPGSMVICRPASKMVICKPPGSEATYNVPFSLGMVLPMREADAYDDILVAWWVPGTSAAATMRAGKTAKVIDIFGPWEQYDALTLESAANAELPEVRVLRADVLLANVQLDEQSRIPFKVFDKLRTIHDVDVSGFSSTHRGNLYREWQMMY